MKTDQDQQDYELEESSKTSSYDDNERSKDINYSN